MTGSAFELSRHLLELTYPDATHDQLDRGARFAVRAPLGPKADLYDADPDRYKTDLEREMFGGQQP